MAVKEYDNIKVCVGLATEQKKKLQHEIFALNYQLNMKSLQRQEIGFILEHLDTLNQIADVFVYNDPTKYFDENLQLIYTPRPRASAEQREGELENAGNGAELSGPRSASAGRRQSNMAALKKLSPARSNRQATPKAGGGAGRATSPKNLNYNFCFTPAPEQSKMGASSDSRQGKEPVRTPSPERGQRSAAEGGQDAQYIVQ